MSVLFEFENCALISHENYINQIYNEVIADDNDRCRYQINSNLFELNVPYRHKTDEDAHTKRRRRKIINKTNQLVAQEHREEYELVFEFKLSLMVLILIGFFLSINRFE